MTTASYYVLPGLVVLTPMEAILKANPHLSETQLFETRNQNRVQARQILFFLEYIAGGTEQSIADKYGFHASNIHYSLEAVRNQIVIYKREATRVKEYANQCNLKNEFLAEYIPLKVK